MLSQEGKYFYVLNNRPIAWRDAQIKVAELMWVVITHVKLAIFLYVVVIESVFHVVENVANINCGI